MASAKRERKRARKVAGGRVSNSACGALEAPASDTGEVAGVGASRPAQHSKGDPWALYQRAARAAGLDPHRLGRTKADTEAYDRAFTDPT